MEHNNLLFFLLTRKEGRKKREGKKGLNEGEKRGGEKGKGVLRHTFFHHLGGKRGNLLLSYLKGGFKGYTGVILRGKKKKRGGEEGNLLFLIRGGEGGGDIHREG